MATTPGLGRPTVQQTAMRAGTGDGPNVRDAEAATIDVSAEDLFEAAKRCRDARIRGAILAVASLDDRMSLTDAARTWRVDLPTLRDVIRRLDDSGARRPWRSHRPSRCRYGRQLTRLVQSGDADLTDCKEQGAMPCT
jgi:hypothetical protein